jgi:DNA repair protein RadA/Sms
MSKQRAVFTCTACGATSPKWAGKCADCGAWNTIVERGAGAVAGPVPKPIPLDDVADQAGGEVRMRTGLGELDNVLGGGLVAGSLILLGGDPGVGKSTLLLMALHQFARRGLPVLYVTGEESARQVHLRGQRLGVSGKSLLLLADTDFANVEEAARACKPLVMVIDSVQTLHLPNVEGIPGSVQQIREVAHRAMQLAKGTGIAVFLVGHVTKSGALAGPKILEHFVDAVLYFEGEGGSPLRALRATKNRFGPTGELGMFEMVAEGLREVPDASARLLAERVPDAPGTAVVCSVEGSRPLLTEVQALVGRPTPGTPGRTCVGLDRNRVALLAAVLEKAGLTLSDRDLYVNAAGGVRLEETAADLGVILALAASLRDRPLRADTAVFGEVGLVGEVRAVPNAAIRLREAARQGFRRVIAPTAAATDAPNGLEVIGVRTVREALHAAF